MQSITNDAVSHEDVECQNLMGAKTGLIPYQSRVIASFSATYPSVSAGPNEGCDKSFDFSAMKFFKEWDKDDAHHGLAITLTCSMHDEKAALVRHIETRLECHPVAKELCLKILDACMD